MISRMKIKIIIIIIGVFLATPLYSQLNQQSDNSPVLDSLMAIIADKNVSFREKCRLDTLVHNTPHLRKYRNQVRLKIIPLAKKEKAYNELFRMYLNIARYYNMYNEVSLSRLYLDSVSMYKDKITDVKELADYYNSEGAYYGTLRQYDKAHDYFLQAIAYYEQTKSYRTIIPILRNMSIGHFTRRNYPEVRKIIEKMKLLPVEEDDRLYANIKIDELAGGYYEGLYWNEKDVLYLDSAQYHYRHAIGIYESLDSINANQYKSSLFFIYVKTGELEVSKPRTDEKLIEHYVVQARKICPPRDSLRLSMMHVLDATLYMEKKEYGKAESKLKEAQHIIDIISLNVPEFKNEYNDIYRKFIDLYKVTGDYKKALEYVELRHELKDQYLEETNNEIIKELDIKYETSEKELKIRELQIEKEHERQTWVLIVAIAFFFIILLVVFLLYNRMLRLKKEKEAVLLLGKMKEKDLEFQTAIADSELNAMQSYLKGLETERERLAKELHDNVANELFALEIRLKETMQIPEIISDKLEELHTDVRNISHDLMPPSFRYAELPEIISDYVSKINKNNIRIDIDIEPEALTDLPENYAIEIYRIIQEAMSNVVRHSDASLATISLRRNKDLLELIIEDNGKGFDREHTRGGIGLHIIEERVKSLNGILDINTKQGCWFRITLSM